MDELVKIEFKKHGWEVLVKKELPTKWKCDVIDCKTNTIIKKDMEVQKRITYGFEQEYIQILIDNINTRIELDKLKRD